MTAAYICANTSDTSSCFYSVLHYTVTWMTENLRQGVQRNVHVSFKDQETMVTVVSPRSDLSTLLLHDHLSPAKPMNSQNGSVANQGKSLAAAKGLVKHLNADNAG